MVLGSNRYEQQKTHTGFSIVQRARLFVNMLLPHAGSFRVLRARVLVNVLDYTQSPSKCRELKGLLICWFCT